MNYKIKCELLLEDIGPDTADFIAEAIKGRGFEVRVAEDYSVDLSVDTVEQVYAVEEGA